MSFPRLCYVRTPMIQDYAVQRPDPAGRQLQGRHLLGFTVSEALIAYIYVYTAVSCRSNGFGT